MIQHPIIFTDMDGTLLDHYSYSFEPAQPMLSYLSKRDIPVIANTSKTFAELIHIRKEIKNNSPFIVENGAAVYVPKAIFKECPEEATDQGAFWLYQFSQSNKHWLDLLHALKPRFQSLYTSFSNLSIDQLANVTGLTTEQAARAAQRQFGEPILWHGDKEDKRLFIEAIEKAGGHVLQGGRFLHIGDNANKGAAMEWLTQLYRKTFPDKQFQSIALGDSHNDIDMLEQADQAVVIASPAHDFPQLSRIENTTYSTSYGPQGWKESLLELLDIPAPEL